MPLRTTVTRVPGTSYDFVVIDDRPLDLRDVTHSVLALSWPKTLGLISLTYLVLNVLFALGFVATGGVANLEPSDPLHAFFFSVQTMATIGYGAMYPQSTPAHLLVVLESLVGPGLHRARHRARLRALQPRAWARRLRQPGVHRPRRGCAAPRGARRQRPYQRDLRRAVQAGADAHHQGRRRADALPLRGAQAGARQRAEPPARVEPDASHRRADPAARGDLGAAQGVGGRAARRADRTGTDETTLQAVHGRRVWEANEIVFGSRPADVLTETEGKMVLDLRRFHDVTPAP